MTEPTIKSDICPSCGEPLPLQGTCCGLDSATAEDEIPVMANLVMSKPTEAVIPINSRWVRIGRDEANQIVLRDDLYASRYHAWVTYEQECFWVEDLGSTNGTLLNGEPLDRREILASGDKIRIGESELTFVLLEKGS